MQAEKYQKIAEAFRRLGPNFPAVGRAAECSTEIAKRAWHTGWEKDRLPPIKETLLDELDREIQSGRWGASGGASAAAIPQTALTIPPTPVQPAPAPPPVIPPELPSGEDEEGEEGEPEQDDEIEPEAAGQPTGRATGQAPDTVDEIVSDEAEILKVSRKTAVLASVNNFRTVRLTGAVVGEVERRIKEEGWLKKATMADLRSLLKTGSEVVQRGNSTLREAIELERMVRGAPMDNVVQGGEGELSEEELTLELSRVKRSIDAASRELDLGESLERGGEQAQQGTTEWQELPEGQEPEEDYGAEPPDWLLEGQDDAG